MNRDRDRDRAALPEPMRQRCPAARRHPRRGHPRLRRARAAGRRGAAAARRDRGPHGDGATRRRRAGPTRQRGRDRGAGRVLEPGPRPSRSPGPSPSTFTWPTWPKSTSASASCGSAIPGSSRCANRSPPRSPRSGTTPGAEHLGELLASLRVHLVLTAHPTEARRRAVVAALRRISELLDVLDDPRAGAADRAEARRVLRENIDLLWRTSQLRVKAMDPIDEVRTVMTAFDETLFRVVPAVYRELDRALAGPDSGQVASPVPAFLRFGSWVGADRDGNPFVTAQVTREAATIQADHVAARARDRHDQDRPGADPARGDDAARRRAAPGAGRRLGRAPGTAGRDRGTITAGAVPDLPAVRGAAAGRDPRPARRPGLPGAGGVPRRPAGRPGVAGRRRAPPSRRSVSCST